MIDTHIPTHSLIGRKARAVRDITNNGGGTIWKGWTVEITGIYTAAHGKYGATLNVRGVARGTLIDDVPNGWLELIEDKPKGQKK